LNRLGKRVVALAAGAALVVGGGMTSLHLASAAATATATTITNTATGLAVGPAGAPAAPQGTTVFDVAVVTGGTLGNTGTVTFNAFNNGTCAGVPNTFLGTPNFTITPTGGGGAQGATVNSFNFTAPTAGSWSIQATTVLTNPADTGSTSACEPLSVTAPAAGSTPTSTAVGCVGGVTGNGAEQNIQFPITAGTLSTLQNNAAAVAPAFAPATLTLVQPLGVVLCGWVGSDGPAGGPGGVNATVAAGSLTAVVVGPAPIL